MKKPQIVEFALEAPHQHVELCNLLKLVGVADSGGQGKALVASGEVMVDGQPEERKTAKIRAGQTVDVACANVRIKVVEG